MSYESCPIVWLTRPLALLAAVSLVLAGCATVDGEQPRAELAPFPAEKVAADFPGISYPAFAGQLPRPGSLGGPVWLIGIDGATWDVVRPLLDEGAMPQLGRLIEEGSRGVLMSEEPTISPALWATIATGVPRFEHGVVSFLVRLPGSYETTTAGPPDRRSPAVWELVGAAGGRSAVVNWFGSYPVEETAGVYVAKGTDPAAAQPGQVHPSSWVGTLRGVEVRLREPDEDRIAKTPFLRRTLLEDERGLAILRAIVERERPDLVALHIAGIDVVQHVTWRHMDPASQEFPQDGPPEVGLREVIPDYYRWLDRAIGELVEMAPAEATLVLVSDHGAGPVQPAEAYHFQLEVLLEQLGLMNGGSGEVFAIDEVYRHDKRIWLNLEGIEPQGSVPVHEAEARAAAIERRLAALRTDDDRPVFASIRNRVADPSWIAGEPALMVRFAAEALLTREVRDGGRRFDFSPVRLRHGDVSGAHRPAGLIVLHGPTIRRGELGEPANLYQIAPTLLYLLGLPQDRRMLRYAPADGGVLVAAIDERLLERHPILMAGGYPGTDRSALLRAPATEDDRTAQPDPAAAEKLEKLRGLGYVR